MARLRGKSIVFTVDNTEFSGGVSNVNFTSEVGELGFGSYEDSLTFKCQVVGYQDFASASLHSKLYDNPGDSIDLKFAPHGNAVATASQPHFTATGYAETLPTIGGAAGEYFTYDLTIILDGKPVRVTS